MGGVLAILAMLVAVAQAPSARDAYARAIALEAAGNDAAALALLWEAAGSAPGDADVQNRLGEALARMGALDAAVQAFDQARQARPGFAKAANNLVLTLVQAGRGPEAVQQARRYMAEAPNDPDRTFTLGLALAEQDVDEAIRTFRRVLERAPSHTLARYNLALALQRVDRLGEAAVELQTAIDGDPRPEAYYTLGIVRWHQGDLDRAVRALRAAVDADPGYASAYDALGGVLRDRRDFTGAEKALRRAIALRPQQPAGYFALARVLQQFGHEADAQRAIEEGERLRRRNQLENEAAVWTAVGVHKLDGGDLLGALDDFRRATAVSETYAPAHYQLGRTLQHLGHMDAAAAAYARAHQLNPSLVAPPVGR